ncbi:hypothetical protein ACIHCM_30920 [Streptomyces sp. NPDC052023]|uniref:hypothetical protein n=1 Tax=Streptomyces sp. NPDC052023 TaxID=3365681 RepID=UPI0037D24BB6
MIRTLGFFSELHPGWGLPPDGSIRDAVGTTGDPDEASIVAYLRGGTGIWSEMGAEPDVLDPVGPSLTGAASLYTDGEWIWREDLIYYVVKYHVTLPEDFLSHVRARDYMPRKVPERRLIAIASTGLGIKMN